MKPKTLENKSQLGFTLVEMLVVISIMATMATLITIDFNRQKASRNIVIAKNETATNLRKVQQYTLSSRNITPGIGARFYIVQFIGPSLSGNAEIVGTQTYSIHAVDNNYNFIDIETIPLPEGVRITALSIEGEAQVDCIQVIYSAPFGTMYVNGATTCDSNIAEVLRDPITLAGLSQALTYISFSGNAPQAGSKYIRISPLTGQITTD